jgi:hypothetical protein
MRIIHLPHWGNCIKKNSVPCPLTDLITTLNFGISSSERFRIVEEIMLYRLVKELKKNNLLIVQNLGCKNSKKTKQK